MLKKLTLHGGKNIFWWLWRLCWTKEAIVNIGEYHLGWLVANHSSNRSTLSVREAVGALWMIFNFSSKLITEEV